ncbi:MAG: hypothetical protein SFZ03_08050 [Candidatus Melainabacteria bacterium]|nr:hypothetical protein [Candidatus Melainabacteria bacterium]
MANRTAKTYFLLLAFLSVLLSVSSPFVLGAERAAKKPYSPIELTAFRALGSFEVEKLHDVMSTDLNRLPGDIEETLAWELSHDKTLPYKSPAEGVIRLRCKWSDCALVIVSVTAGTGGPEVWSTQVRRFIFPDWPGNVNRTSQTLAKHIVKRLKADYVTPPNTNALTNVNTPSDTAATTKSVRIPIQTPAEETGLMVETNTRPSE